MRYTACRSAFRSIPDIEAEAPTIDVKQTRYDARAEIPLDRLLQPDPRPRRLSPTIATTRSRTPARSPRPSSPGRRRPGRAGPDRTRRLGRNQRRPISRPQGPHRRRGKIPARKQAAPGRPVHHAEPGPRPAPAGGRLPRRDSASSSAEEDADLGTPALKRNFTTFSGSAGAAYEFSPGWRAGVTLSLQLARAVDRGAVRQRPARRHPGVRGRRSRPRYRTQHSRRGEPPPIRGPGPPDRDGLLQPLLQLHFPDADRRDRG